MLSRRSLAPSRSASACTGSMRQRRANRSGAGQALSHTVFSQNVEVEDLGDNKYGRTLAIIRLGDNNIYVDFVQGVWAWWCRQYPPHNRGLSAAEESARKARRGLWADRQPVPPWA